MKKVFPIFAVLIGIYWIIRGISYGFWVRNGPGGGFFPVISGVLAVILGIFILIKQKKDEGKSEFTIKAFLPIGGILAIALSSYVFGLIISVALYVFSWLRFIEKYKTSKSVIVGVCCSVIIYLIFVTWLCVPFPKGIIGLI